MREQHGEPDVIMVRKTFKTAEKAVCWEEKVIRRMDLAKRDEWLNRNNTSTGTKGIVNVPKTQAQKEHQRQQILGKKHTQETKDKIAAGMKNHKRTKEHGEALSKALTGIKKPSLMNGRHGVCEICGANTYHTDWQLKRNIKKNCCSAACSRLRRKRLKK